MDRRFLLEGAVRRMCAGAACTTAPEILVELQKSVEWGDVTISQVRRINTACNKLEPQLDPKPKLQSGRLPRRPAIRSVIAPGGHVQQS